ncbi:MAG TPA: hypothetical protein VF145_13620 [Chitinophagaceae bacterium]
MKLLACSLISLLFFTQCQKSSDSIAISDFQPLTVGSNWTYISNGSSFKLTVTNKDTVALTRTYKVLSNDNGGNQYQAKYGNEYFRFATFQGVLPNGVEELYLKGDQAVNSTWQLTIPLQTGSVTINVTAKYTITEKGISKQVQGVTYNDVVHVRQDLSSAFGNNGGGDFYYAKGVGLISSTLAITFPGQNINNTTELTAFEIK